MLHLTESQRRVEAAQAPFKWIKFLDEPKCVDDVINKCGKIWDQVIINMCNNRYCSYIVTILQENLLYYYTCYTVTIIFTCYTVLLLHWYILVLIYLLHCYIVILWYTGTYIPVMLLHCYTIIYWHLHSVYSCHTVTLLHYYILVLILYIAAIKVIFSSKAE